MQVHASQEKYKKIPNLKYFYIQALKYQYNLPQLGIGHYLSVFPGFFSLLFFLPMI